jgi:hypothetical protein
MRFAAKAMRMIACMMDLIAQCCKGGRGINLKLLQKLRKRSF